MRRMKSTAIASTAIMTIQMGCTAIVGLALPPSATAQESDADLAKKLANPISAWSASRSSSTTTAVSGRKRRPNSL